MSQSDPEDTHVEGIDVNMEPTRVQDAPLRDEPRAQAAAIQPFKLGRYTVRELIGKGGMAEVFLATQDGPAGFEKTCVVKRMRRSLIEEKRFVDMFLREARIAARLNHPNVVQIFELGEVETGGQTDYFIAMEFLDGLSLYRAARRSWNAKESVPMEVALRAMADAALGLHHAHTLVVAGKPSSLVHRDVSPDNIILTRDGISKVLDFGIAKGLEVNDMTGTGEVKGKIPFMSPEQLRGDPLDGRSDLWSLGVTFYWLLTGRRPFDGPNEPMTIDNVLRKTPEPPRAVNPLIPPSLDALVLSLLEKDRDKRCPSGAVLADRLLAMLGPSSSTSAAAAFLAHVTAMEDANGTAPISALTVVAARPESQWLKRLDSGATGLQNLVPSLTPTDARARVAAPMTAEPAPPTKETVTGLHTASFVPSAKPYAIAAGAAAAAVVGLAAFLVVRAPSEPPPLVVTPAVAPAPDVPPAPQPPAPSTATSTPTPAPTPPEAPPTANEPAPATDLQATAQPDVAATKPTERATRATKKDDRIAVKATAPGRVTWKVNGKTVGNGSGTLKLPPGTTKVTAIDGDTGGVIQVPVENESVSFSKVKSGTLVVRARPWAEVKLGNKALGTTPFDPITLPEGRYELTFVRDDKTKKQTVDVKAGGTANANVDMR